MQWLALLAALWVHLPLYAQPPKLNLKLKNANNLQIGDQFQLQIAADQPLGTQLFFPPIPDSLGHFAVIDSGKTEALLQNGILHLQRTLSLTTTEPGSYTLPPLLFSYTTPSGSRGQITTDSVHIAVGQPQIDPQADIKPIKPLMDVPLQTAEWLPYIALPALLLIGLAVYLWQRRRRKVTAPPAPTPSPKPPFEVAITALQQLDNAQLWQRGEVKTYYSELTNIVRQYIEDQYQKPALESTTDELLVYLRQLSLPADIYSKVRKMFTEADLVKFAKAEPSPTQHYEALHTAQDFIQTTKNSFTPTSAEQPEPDATVTPAADL